MARPRKPTKLRILEGNRSKSPIPKGEPEPPPGRALPPPNITGELADLWHELAEPLEHMGLLTVADASAFEKLVVLEHTLRTLAPMILTDERAMRDYHKLIVPAARAYQQFGMTPAARATMAPGTAKTSNPLNEFLARGG